MTDATDATTSSTEAELQAWREVHEHLSKAVLVADEAVNVAKAQRRYWLEIFCANLTPEGKLVNTSAWKKATTRKTAAKRKPAEKSSTAKRKRKANETDDDKRQNWQKSIRLSVKVPQTTTDAAMSLAHLYAGDQTTYNIGEDQPAMTPMQAAQSGVAASFPPAVRHLAALLCVS